MLLNADTAVILTIRVTSMKVLINNDDVLKLTRVIKKNNVQANDQ